MDPHRIDSRPGRDVQRLLKGRFDLIRYSSVTLTCLALPRLRIRLRFLELARWRRPAREVRIFPVAVILKRFATAFFVFRLALALGITLSLF